MPAAVPTILVTGGAGFIGSHVCDALLAQGHAVRCLDNLATGKLGNIEHLQGANNFTFVQGDIREARDVEQALVGVDAVVHLAALGSVPRSIAFPLDSEAANLGGFLNVLEAARHAGLKRIVYASSSSVYGDSPALPKREGQEGNPLSPYAVTKMMDEVYAGLYHRLFGIETIGLRFFNIFGERQDPEGAYAAAIPKFIRALLKHEAPVVHGDGHQTRDFTYVGNAVQAVQLALETPKACAGEVFNIAYGDSCDLLDLIGKLQSRLARIDPAIAGVGVEHAPPRAGDVRASLADVSKAKEQLGYAPRFSLDEGLERAVPWYAEHWR
ncbi:MAG: SDR family oxidoreductase [Flavobacteriales bacterium]|jgi:UDP-N-acetylglucosamine 4-epimerase|nr:SDR family oxidoreductase [Flavobacteriales bacterium]